VGLRVGLDAFAIFYLTCKLILHVEFRFWFYLFTNSTEQNCFSEGNSLNFNATQRFIAAFTTADYRSLSESDESSPHTHTHTHTHISTLRSLK
jgi:hypothetical protein